MEGGTLIQARLGWTTFAIGMAIVSTTAIIVVIGFELAGHHVMSKEGKSGSETVVPLVFVLLLLTGFFSLGSVLARPQEDQLCNWLSQVSSSGEAR